jgi:integration host factor subunit beta
VLCVQRAVVVAAIAVLCACERGAPSSGEPTAGLRLRNAIEKLEPEHYIYLAGVGWLNLRFYARYDGRNPRTGEPVNVAAKYVPFFDCDPDLERELNGEPARNKAFASEGDRWHDAFRGADRSMDPKPGDEPEPDDDVTIAHYAWSDTLAAALRRDLVRHGTAAVPEVGAFDVFERSDGSKGIGFERGDELDKRLQARAAAH